MAFQRVPLSTAVLRFLLLYLACISQSQGTVELKYALFTSGPTGGFDSSGAVPAIELAEEMVNQNNSVLSGYTLTHTDVKDTECDRKKSLDLFFDAIDPTNPTIIALLGCGCSVASTPVAEVVHYKSISQVSYASSSVEINNRVRFPNFFRTYPSDADFPPTAVSVIEHFGWKRIVFLTQEEGLFTGAFDQLKGPLGNLNVEIVNRLLPSENLPIPEISDTNFFYDADDYRVIFINTYSNIARHIICEAYKRGYTYPRYVWLLYAWYADEWWTERVNPGTANCTDNQLAGLLEKGIAMQIYPMAADGNAMTDTGLTPNEFYQQYEIKLNTSSYGSSYLASVAYDAVWSLVFALDRTNTMLMEDTRDEVLNKTGCLGMDTLSGTYWELVPLENFTYANELTGCVIRWNLKKTDFIGISGPVQFNEAGSRIQSQSQILQYRLDVNDTTNETLHRDLIAVTTFTNGSAVYTYQNDESDNTVYPESENGRPPDGTPFTLLNTYNTALVVIYDMLAALGIVFSTVCLVFNFTQRKKKVVRLTSPNLNYFIIAGTYIMYISIFFRIMPSTEYLVNVARCNLDALLNTIGYCLAFGVVLVKMGRLYYIFHNPTSNKMAVKDWLLIAIILAIAGLGTLIAVLQVTVPILRPAPQLDPDHEYGTGKDEYGVSINYMVYQCFSGASSEANAWLIITFVYLALLQLIGIILAIQTRKIKIKVLNDSKYIAALIYISSIVLVLIAIVQFVLGNLINVNETIFAGGILIISTAFLSLLFIPKMVSLYRDPEGEKIFDKQAPHSQNIENTLSKNRLSTPSCDQTRLEELEQKVIELERQLKQQKGEGKRVSIASTTEDIDVTTTAAVTNPNRKLSEQPLLEYLNEVDDEIDHVICRNNDADHVIIENSDADHVIIENSDADHVIVIEASMGDIDDDNQSSTSA